MSSRRTWLAFALVLLSLLTLFALVVLLVIRLGAL